MCASATDNNKITSHVFSVTASRKHENIPILIWPLKPHFYIVKLGFTGVYNIFYISAQKRRLSVPVRTASVR